MGGKILRKGENVHISLFLSENIKQDVNCATYLKIFAQTFLIRLCNNVIQNM